MDSSVDGAIVVGVTGPGRETAALRFAAECARREGVKVILAHAFGIAPPLSPPSGLLPVAKAADVAHWVVKEVGEEFQELTHGSVEFRTLCVAGAPARVMVDLSRGARMVIVQHRHPHGLGRFFIGSTAHGAAAHAACPVVSVHSGWQPADAPAEVVVGVHEGGVPREALTAAFDWAAATGASLRVVHAWRLDPAYDDIITDQVAAQWHDEQKEALDSAVGGLRGSHPTVEVVVEVRHQWPSDVLVDASQVASLVVVGRHGPHVWSPERLGSLARTVLREARCPVMVVPVRAERDAPEDWGLVADEISPQA